VFIEAKKAHLRLIASVSLQWYPQQEDKL